MTAAANLPSASTPLAWAYLAPDCLQLQQNRGEQRGTYPIALGWRTVVERAWPNGPLQETAIEQGIALVEDHVIPAHRWLQTDVPLHSASSLWLQLGQVCGIEPLQAPLALTRDAVENVFWHWAQHAAQGRHAPDLPQEPAWAAALLILRECLHHWSRHEIWLVPPPPPEERERPHGGMSAFAASFFTRLN